MAEERGGAEALRLWVPVVAAVVGLAVRVARGVWGLVRRVDRVEQHAVTDEALAPQLGAIRAELREHAQQRAAAEARHADLERRVGALEAALERGGRRRR